MVTTFAGSCKGYVDGYRPNSRFNFPRGMCINSRDQCLYVCDTGNRSIRRVTMQGTHISSHLSISFFNWHGWCRRCHHICCQRENTSKTKWNRHGLYAWRLLRCLLQQYDLQDNIIRYAILYCFFNLYVFYISMKLTLLSRCCERACWEW